MESIITYVSGQSLGNPGLAAIGVSVNEADGTLIHEVKQVIGNANKDFATYYAVMVAFEELEKTFGDITSEVNFEIRLDNELVKKQLNSELEIKEPGLVPLFIEVHNRRVANFPHTTFILIGEEQNKKASRLAAEAIAGN